MVPPEKYWIVEFGNPDFKLEPLAQVYRRIGTSGYRYESDGLAADLEVEEAGFVIHYPSLWQVEAS